MEKKNSTAKNTVEKILQDYGEKEGKIEKGKGYKILKTAEDIESET